MTNPPRMLSTKIDVGNDWTVWFCMFGISNMQSNLSIFCIHNLENKTNE